MELSEIVKVFQAPLSPNLPRAIAVLHHFDEPLSAKEAESMHMFLEEQRTQLAAGFKAEEPSADMQKRLHRPLTAGIHPLYVSQCVLMASQSYALTAHQHRELRCQVLPTALLRYPLPLSAAAMLLQFASKQPLGRHPETAKTVRVVLQSIGLSLFERSPSMWGNACSSFNLARSAATTAGGERQFGALPPAKTEYARQDVQALWWDLLSKVVEHYAVRHQSGQSALTSPPSAADLPFVATKQSRSLAHLVASSLPYITPASVAAGPLPSFSQLSALQQLSLVGLFPASAAGAYSISASSLLSVMKQHPGAIARLFGSPNPAARSKALNRLHVSGELDDLLSTISYQLGLTTNTEAVMMDCLAILLSLRCGTSSTQSCLSVMWSTDKKAGDVCRQLLMPFITNSRAMTARVARLVAPMYEEMMTHFLSTSPSQEVLGEVLSAVLECSLELLASRCRASVEKAVVSMLVVSLTQPLRRAAEASYAALVAPHRSAMVRYVAREIASPSAESVVAGMQLVSLWGLEVVPEAEVVDPLLDSYRVALKNARRDPEILPALLATTPRAVAAAATFSNGVVGILTGEVLPLVIADWTDVNTVGISAFLLPYLVLPHSSTNSSDVIPYLPNMWEALIERMAIQSSPENAAAQVAEGEVPAIEKRILTVAQWLSTSSSLSLHTPLVLLSVSPFGWVKEAVTSFLRSEQQRLLSEVSPTAAKEWTLALWNDFAIALTSGRLVGTSVVSALMVFARLAIQVLRNSATSTSSEDVTSFLASLLTCVGHDTIQGADSHFFYPYPAPSHQSTQTIRMVPLLLALLRRSSWLHTLPTVTSVMAALMKPFQKETAPTQVVASARAVVLFFAALEHTTKAAASAASLGEEASDPRLHHCLGVVLQAVKASVVAVQAMPPLEAAVASERADLIADEMDAELTRRGVRKTYPTGSKPPKGMKMDDFLDMKRKDEQLLVKERAKLQDEVQQMKQKVVDASRGVVAPLALIQWLGRTPGVSLAIVSAFYPYLLELLNGESAEVEVTAEQRESRDPRLHVALAAWVESGVHGLLMRTSFSHLGDVLTATTVSLWCQKFLQPQDVSRLATLASAVRRANTKIFPPYLLDVLRPFCMVAFKAGKSSGTVPTSITLVTQHQLLGLVLQNINQFHIPHPTRLLELLAFILRNFPGLYKSVLQGALRVTSLIAPEDLVVVERALFSDGDGVRDAAATAFSQFSHFDVCRRALLLAAIFVKDVVKCSTKAVEELTLIVTRHQFIVQTQDWADLLYFLSAYGKEKSNVLLILQTMRNIFTIGSTSDEEKKEWVAAITALGGIAGAVSVGVLADLLPSSAAEQVMEHLCTVIEAGASDAIMREVLQAGRGVLNEVSLDALRAIAPRLNTRLSRPPKDAVGSHKELYLATTTVWLTVVSCRLKDLDLLKSIVDQQSRTLSNSTSQLVHRAVCDAMQEITKNEEVRQMSELDEFMEKCLKQALHSGSYVRKKAHAWGIAGVIAGLGLPGISRYQLIRQLNGAQKNTDRMGSAIVVETLCEVLGSRFEPYAIAVCEVLLSGVDDADKEVAACADDAAQMMMKNCLSSVGLRQLVPRVVSLLDTDQAKRRVAPLNFIGHVASCSPKELAATLPVVMKHIIPCLFEVNNFVSTAAYNALRRVAGVVSNPEIQEQLEVILKAMRSPNSETDAALDALMYTRFVNVVDPASLALIIPVILRGLNGQLRNTRSRAAQIAASMVLLVGESSSLIPYADDLILALEGAAQDPEAEARTTAAKALAALCCSVGLHSVHRVALWCLDMLQRQTSGAIEKAGSGQVFAELINKYGMTLLEHYFEVIEKGMNDERPGVREGFLYIMVYAPSTFDPSFFQEFLPSAFPWVLSGLSHYSDRVRDVALSAGDAIISLYGTRNISLVLAPLLEGASSEVTSLRHSALLLICKLLLHLAAGIRKKFRIQSALQELQQQRIDDAAAAEEDEAALGYTGGGDDAEGGMGLTVEAARDVEKRGVSLIASLEEVLGAEAFSQVFAVVYCGCHEHAIDVRTEANQAWQACVASIRMAVKKIFGALVHRLVHLASSENPDCVEAAMKSVEHTSRMQETIDMFIEAFCDVYESAASESAVAAAAVVEVEGAEEEEEEDEEEEVDDAEARAKKNVVSLAEIQRRRVMRGCFVCLSTVTTLADSKKLISMGGQLVGCILPGMQHHDETVQAAARELFDKVSRSVGPRLIEDAVEAQLRTSIRGVVEVVKARPHTALQIIIKSFLAESVLTDHDVSLLSKVVETEEAEEELQTAYVSMSLLTILLKALQQGLEEAQDVLQSLVMLSRAEIAADIMTTLQKLFHSPATRLAAIHALEAYVLGTDVEVDTDGISVALGLITSALADEDSACSSAAVLAVSSLLTDLEERYLESLEEEEEEEAVLRRLSGRYLTTYVEVMHDTFSAAARSNHGSSVFPVLAEGKPRLFDTLLAFFLKGLEYSTSVVVKVAAVEAVGDLVQFAPPEVIAAASNTLAGRCAKVLFARNDGKVVHALLTLCLQLLHLPSNGKEKMMEGTLALAMFNAVLCDSGEARVTALLVVMELLQRSTRYAELLLGNVLTKKAAVDSPLNRTVLCRFLSVVMRYGDVSRTVLHVPKLMAIVKPMWAAPESPGQAAAAGVAVGALCKSASIDDAEVLEIKEETLRKLGSRGSASLAGFATVHSLITMAPQRVDADFLSAATTSLLAVARSGAMGKHTLMWLLRSAAAIAGTGKVPVAAFAPEYFCPLLNRVLTTDEQLMSAADYFYNLVSTAYPSATDLMEQYPRAVSSACDALGHYDADIDDELVAEDFSA